MEIMVPERLRPTNKDGSMCKCMDREHLIKYKKAVVHWLVEEGSPVSEGEAVCELEIDKKIFTVTAAVSGILKEKYVQEQEEFSCKDAVGMIEP